MKLGIVTDSLGAYPFEEMLRKVSLKGIECLELTTGGWSCAPHLDLDLLLSSKELRSDYIKKINDFGLTIGALNCSGNQLAPNSKGEKDKITVEKTLQLANELGVSKLVMMSGLPGGSCEDTTPTWITTSWPPENLEIENWQWNERVLPYWYSLVKKAKEYGIKQIALENHGCQAVYNDETLIRLRDNVGQMIGMNLDPSHLFWMGGDPMQMVRNLEGMIYHVHAKDVRIENGKCSGNGLLDTKTIDRWKDRSWNYVALGYGHDLLWWKTFFSTLIKSGYDDLVSLEMEDMSMSPEVGIDKSLDVLKLSMI